MPAAFRFLPAANVALALLACVSPASLAADKPQADEFNAMDQDSIVPAESQLELLWSEGEFTEGPVAAGDGAILFSDIGDQHHAVRSARQADGRISRS